MDKQIIDTAMAAHSLWRSHLEDVIQTGKLDTPINEIKVDNGCALGKWLYGPTISTEDKSSAHYKMVKKLHAKFHTTAARVAELASTGKTAEAEKLMARGGEFAMISSKLTDAMMKWKENI